MERRLLAKLASWFIAATCIAALFHHSYAAQTARGYDAFIARQQHRWATNVTHPHWVPLIVASLLATGVFLAIYELLALAVRKALKA
jgi:hypothetical protein